MKLNDLNGHFRNNSYNSVRWACLVSLAPKRKREVPFNMAILNGERVHECFPNKSRMGTATMKWDKEIVEEGKNRGVGMVRSKEDTNERSPDDLSLRNQNNINKHNIVVFYKTWKKYNEIRLKPKT